MSQRWTHGLPLWFAPDLESVQRGRLSARSPDTKPRPDHTRTLLGGAGACESLWAKLLLSAEIRYGLNVPETSGKGVPYHKDSTLPLVITKNTSICPVRQEWWLVWGTGGQRLKPTLWPHGIHENIKLEKLRNTKRVEKEKIGREITAQPISSTTTQPCWSHLVPLHCYKSQQFDWTFFYFFCHWVISCSNRQMHDVKSNCWWRFTWWIWHGHIWLVTPIWIKCLDPMYHACATQKPNLKVSNTAFNPTLLLVGIVWLVVWLVVSSRSQGYRGEEVNGMELNTDRAWHLEVQDDGPNKTQRELWVPICNVIIPDVHQLDLRGDTEKGDTNTK